jgi:hypothetical protein
VWRPTRRVGSDRRPSAGHFGAAVEVATAGAVEGVGATAAAAEGAGNATAACAAASTAAAAVVVVHWTKSEVGGQSGERGREAHRGWREGTRALVHLHVAGGVHRHLPANAIECGMRG